MEKNWFAQEVKRSLEKIIVFNRERTKKRKEENNEGYEAETNGVIGCGFAGVI
jgi:hypothetical protein